VLWQVTYRAASLPPETQRTHYLDVMAAVFTAWEGTAQEAVRSVLPRNACRELDRVFESSLHRNPGTIEPDLWTGVFEVLAGLDDDRVWRSVSGAHEGLARQQASLRKRTRTSMSIGRVDGTGERPRSR